MKLKSVARTISKGYRKHVDKKTQRGLSKAWKSEAGNQIRRAAVTEGNRYIRQSRGVVVGGITEAAGGLGEMYGGEGGRAVAERAAGGAANRAYNKVEDYSGRQKEKLDAKNRKSKYYKYQKIANKGRKEFRAQQKAQQQSNTAT
jgi:hypothetical protein